MAEEEEAVSITPGSLSEHCDTDFSDKSSMEQQVVSVHVSTKHIEKQVKNEFFDIEVSSSNLNDYISTRQNEKPIKAEFVDGDEPSSNSNDCIALHTEMDIKLEPTPFSDTECETEKVCDETDIKTEKVLVGEMPWSDSERKVKLYDGTDIKTENLLVGEMPLNDTERQEKVYDGTDTKTEIILLDGMRSNDTESKMTNALGFSYNVDVTFLCKQCDAEFHVKSELAQHMLVHDSTTDPERSTTTTGQRISDELYQASRSAVNTLQLHAACSNGRVQTNPTPAKTDYPESEPDTSFNTHLRTDTGGTIIRTRSNMEPKLYECNLCDFKCAKSYYLNSHLRTHSDKPYKCKLCDYRGAQKCHLKIHFRTHTQEKPYKCNLCNFKSVSSTGLTVHIRTHTGDKPYKCSLCNYKTTQSQHLKLHFRTHTGDKPYQCNLCDFKAAQSSNLTVHLETHLKKEKMYKCNLCKFKSKNQFAVEEHMKTHYTGFKTLQMF